MSVIKKGCIGFDVDSSTYDYRSAQNNKDNAENLLQRRLKCANVPNNNEDALIEGHPEVLSFGQCLSNEGFVSRRRQKILFLYYTQMNAYNIYSDVTQTQRITLRRDKRILKNVNA